MVLPPVDVISPWHVAVLWVMLLTEPVEMTTSANDVVNVIYFPYDVPTSFVAYALT